MTRFGGWLLLAVSFAGYVALAILFPLTPAYAQLPLTDLRGFLPDMQGGVAYALLLIALFLLLWLAAFWLSRGRLRLAWWHAAIVTALFAAPLLATYPINANDLFRYFIRGRITVEYQTNALTARPTDFPDDPYVPFAGEWAGETTPYGPVWELLAALVYRVTGGSMLWGLVGFKLVGLTAHIACGWVIWRLLAAADSRTRMARTVLWLWNPALLLMFVVDAHNDVLMLLWLLAGYALQQRGRPVAGMTVMVLAVLTKLIALLALPYFFVALLLAAPDQRERWRIGLGSVGGGVLVTLLAFAPFGSPVPLIERLMRESSAGGGFSPPAAVILAGRTLFFDPPVDVTVRLFQGIFVVVLGWLLFLAWRGRSPLRGSADSFAAYLVTAFKFRIWYPTWLAPWVILDLTSTRRLNAVMLFLLTSQLSVIVYGHMRFLLFDGEPEMAHFVAVPLVFGVPLLALLWPLRLPRRRLRRRESASV